MIMDDLAKVHEEAHIKIADMYGKNIPDDGGNVTVSVGNTYYVVYFCKVEDGWNIIKTERL